MLNKKYLIFLIWTLFGILNNSISVSIADENLRQDIYDFVKEIKENTDTTVNPCDNFPKYACGRIKNLNTEYFRSSYLKDITSYIKELFSSDNEPTTDLEKTYRKIYLDYKISLTKYPNDFSIFKDIYNELDFLNKFGKFPVERDILTNKSIAELEAQFIPVMLGNFLNIEVIGNIAIVPSAKPKIFEIKNIFNLLSDNRSSTEEIKTAENNVIEFNKKMIQLYENDKKKWENKYVTNNNIIQISSFDELNQILPSSKIDWKTFEESVNNYFNFNKYFEKRNIRIFQLDFLKEIIKLIDSTDIQTITNYQIYRFLMMLKTKSDFITSDFINFLKEHIILKKIWDDTLTDRTVERYTNFLDYYEESFNNTIEKIPNLKNKNIYQNVFSLKRNILKNHTILITNEYIKELYKDYDFDKPFKSLIKFIKKNTQQRINELFIGYSNTTIVEGFIKRKYFDAIQPNFKNKPNFFYYGLQQFVLWYEYLKTNYNKPNVTSYYICFKQINEFVENYNGIENEDIYYYSDFIHKYAAFKLSLNSIISNEKLTHENEIINELIEPEKLFFIVIAQQTCREEQKIDNESERYSYRNTDEFYKTFSCPQDLKMTSYKNNMCHILEVCQNVIPNMKEIMTYILKEC